MNPIHAIKLVTVNPARYFGLDQFGAVAPGKLASLAILEDLESCRVSRVYHAGQLAATGGVAIDRDAAKRRAPILRSSINVQWLEPEQLAIKAPPDVAECNVHVIEVRDGHIDTERSIERMKVVRGLLHADPKRDLCKLAVIERHQASGNTGLGFVRGFGFASGAIASSVGHDSHNLVIAGTNDHDMFTAAVHLVKIRGGLCVVKDGTVLADVTLPIGGLMSNEDPQTLSAQLRALHEAAQALGGTLRRPFMALSFLSLSVIGALKLTDQGLVDVDQFKLIDLVAD